MTLLSPCNFQFFGDMKESSFTCEQIVKQYLANCAHSILKSTCFKHSAQSGYETFKNMNRWHYRLCRLTFKLYTPERDSFFGYVSFSKVPVQIMTLFFVRIDYKAKHENGLI